MLPGRINPIPHSSLRKLVRKTREKYESGNYASYSHMARTPGHWQITGLFASGKGKQVSFLYEATFTFKAREIIEALDRKIEQLREEARQQEAEMAKQVPEGDVSELFDQMEDIEAKLGLVVGHNMKKMRRAMRRNKSPHIDTLRRSKIATNLRIRNALATQDPHRQYKMSLHDVQEYDIIPMDDVDELTGEPRKVEDGD